MSDKVSDVSIRSGQEGIEVRPRGLEDDGYEDARGVGNGSIDRHRAVVAHGPDVVDVTGRPPMLDRVAECARIDRLLADAREGLSGVLIIRGEPGIGKSSLLHYAADQAEGMTILTARGIESEAQVPFSGLSELLRPVLNRIDRLPEPQAVALRGALAIGPAVESDRLGIGAATLNVLTSSADQSPVLALIDDSHWLDESSAAALTFAARRLMADAIAMIFALPTGEKGVFEEAGFKELVLEGLDRDTSAALLGRHAHRAVPAGIAERLFRATAGNPLALVELADEAPHLGVDPLDAPIPVGTSVERAFLRRAGALSTQGRRALVVAAAADSTDMATVQQAATALGIDTTSLEEAERAGLVEIAEGHFQFHHPLVRSAVYHDASPADRRAIHGAIAAALVDERDLDRCAWHLAFASFGPDEDVAAALEQAGGRARGRSAYAVAAAAFLRAARLTPEARARAPRLFAAADAAWLAGQAQLTIELLEETLEYCSEPRLRADAQHLRGRAAMRTGPATTAYDILVEGASEIESLDPEKAAVMLAEAADACVYSGRPVAMLETAQRSWELLPTHAGERVTAFACLALGTALIYNGRGAEGARLLRAAIEIIDGSDVLGDDPQLLSWAALGPLWLREVKTGRALFDRAIQTARRQGALGALPFALFVAARDAATTDRWALAESQYDEAIRLARDTGQVDILCGLLAGLAWVEARRGREPACREHAREAITLSKKLGLAFFQIWGLSALADLDMGAGRFDAALELLQQKEGALSELGIADPDISPDPELVEVFLRLGRAGDAQRVADRHAARAKEKGQPWALARAATCLGMLADDENFEDHFTRALHYHEGTLDIFEAARTRLIYGERLRRAKRRVRSREELRAALIDFEAIGADPWAERARRELQATGETARRRDVSTSYQLTPQELQIAMVLAEGKTTREAAAQLFLSPKTIEYHLRNVYRKLEISSRAQLVRALKQEATSS